jgi:PleD family two-component response regulator
MTFLHSLLANMPSQMSNRQLLSIKPTFGVANENRNVKHWQHIEERIEDYIFKRYERGKARFCSHRNCD